MQSDLRAETSDNSMAAINETLAERSERALDGPVRQVIEAHGGGITLDTDPTGKLRVNFKGRCASCPSAAITMASLVRPALLAVEGVTSVTRSGGTSRFAEERIAKMFNITS